MRRFHSYGPVNSKNHFCVERKDLIARCADQLIGDSVDDGHYFTLWAPRQTGKTWLMRQVKKVIKERYGDKFIVGSMSVQGVIMKDDDHEELFLHKVPQLMKETFRLEIEAPPDWDAFKNMFFKKYGLFAKPVILFIDEFDSLPAKLIDRLVTLFRDMYLKRDSYLLHGLGFIGVQAVLGVGSDRGSPFNIQRSLHIKNFTQQEVEELFRQYQDESVQKIEPEVVNKVYEATTGQPGLVCWFGELLTETYNPGREKVIDTKVWKRVYRKACNLEWNNTILNLIKKAKGKYIQYVLDLFGRTNIPFRLDMDWCNFLYLNGIIDVKTQTGENGEEEDICCFSSPFVQERLYNALTDDFVGERMPILALEPLDELKDVFSEESLNLPALLKRYIDYLARLKAKRLNPWKDQPRRVDLHFTEAVGHFHLYSWLASAVGRRCVISPEFPAGNGKVDLHLRCGEKLGIIEVKSFIDAFQVQAARKQAADYAAGLGLDSVVVAMFVPTDAENVLEKLSGEENINRIMVSLVAIGWT